MLTQKWLFRRIDRRRCERTVEPPLRAYFWDGSVTSGCRIRDIGPEGAFIESPMKWSPGTLIKLSLCREDEADAKRVVTVESEVVRRTNEGMGLRFVPKDGRAREPLQRLLAWASRNRGGHSLIEFALVLPLLLLLVVNIVNFGAFFHAWITVHSAARSGVQYLVMGGATVRAPDPPSHAQVINVVQNDAYYLPNRATLLVRVCTKNPGAAAVCTGTGAQTPPGDPESASYAQASCDVTYTYQPLVGSWSIPGLGVHLTLPPTTIHQQALMRILQ